MYKVGAVPEVGIAELRRELKAWLERVRSGDEVIVTDRGRPVARFSSINAPTRLDTLVSSGVESPPTRPRAPATGSTSYPRDGARLRSGHGGTRAAAGVIAYFDASALVKLLVAEAGNADTATLVLATLTVGWQPARAPRGSPSSPRGEDATSNLVVPKGCGARRWRDDRLR